MRSFAIVVSAPGFHLFLGICRGKEPVFVQALLPEAAVERLDEGVVRGLARPAEVQFYTVQVSPLVQSLRSELRVIVYPDGPGQPVLLHQPLQHLHDLLSADAGRNLYGQTLTSEVIDYR